MVVVAGKVMVVVVVAHEQDFSSTACAIKKHVYFNIVLGHDFNSSYDMLLEGCDTRDRLASRNQRCCCIILEACVVYMCHRHIFSSSAAHIFTWVLYTCAFFVLCAHVIARIFFEACVIWALISAAVDGYCTESLWLAMMHGLEVVCVEVFDSWKLT
jgi:hypothetical protein